MRKTKMYTGLLIGTAMMMAASGSTMAATKQAQTKTFKTADKNTIDQNTAGKNIQDKKTTDKTAAASAEKENKELFYYGKIKNIDKDKIEIETADVVWQKEDNAANKSQEDAAKKANASSKKDGTDVKADFETENMKWKLNGKSVVLSIDKDTKYLLGVIEANAKESKIENDNKVTDKKTTDTKTTDTKTTDTKTTDKKTTDTKTTGNKADEKNTADKTIKADELKAGTIVQIVQKDKNSMIAAEIHVISDVKNGQNAEKKTDVKSVTKADRKVKDTKKSN